jgi:hypothetical protein
MSRVRFQNRIVGVVGRKGSGKSTQVRRLLPYCPRVFIWDPMNDYGDLVPDNFNGNNWNSGGGGTLGKYLRKTREVQTFAVNYVPQGDLEGEFEAVCALVYGGGRMLFVIEEAPLVMKAGYMPPAFGRIVRTGRHRKLDVLWTAQRAAEVSRTLTGMTDLYVFFSQTEPRDLDSIAERCGPQIANEVARLGLHDHFVYDVIDREEIADSPRLLKRPISEYDFTPPQERDRDA